MPFTTDRGVLGRLQGGEEIDVTEFYGELPPFFRAVAEAGGLMTYGIPGFKLEKDVVMRRNKQLEEGGVTFRLNCNVGEDISFDEIRAKHDAIIIATGVYKSRDLQAPGSPVLAKMAATADRLSGGRLTLGMGVGFLRGEFAAGVLTD